MAVIGGFGSDLSITRKTDGILETFPQVPKSRIKENGGKHIFEPSLKLLLLIPK